MARMTDFKVPFDEDGNQVAYFEEWLGHVERDNFEFDNVLEYEGFVRGRSAARIVFRKTDGKTVQVFLKDFEAMVPYMDCGRVSGRFTFCKRGENFGCRLIKEK